MDWQLASAVSHPKILQYQDEADEAEYCFERENNRGTDITTRVCRFVYVFLVQKYFLVQIYVLYL